jgi:hypothetical protein
MRDHQGPHLKMRLKIVLDFDGVLFNSAFEAYSVCNRSVQEDGRYRQTVGFEEFLSFRGHVVDAWQYRRLYDESVYDSDFAALEHVEPTEEDWAFAERFFATRRTMMEDPDWPKVMAPYDFFFMLKPLLLSHPGYFHVLSTRDSASIGRTMDFFGAGGIAICGQEDIRDAGSKLEAARCFGWLKEGENLIVYVDDMSHHLRPFEGQVHLPLHADWGYDSSAESSLNQHQVYAIISSMLKLINDPIEVQ